jgi:hypothetical protein
MKRIIVLLVTIFIICQAQAQFTGTDSLRNYNNRYITNNPATSFTNLRLNTLLRGMIDWIDTARAGTGGGGALGVDTLYAINDSTIRYRKSGVFRNFVMKGVYDTRRKLDTLYKTNDSTLKFTINGVLKTLIVPGNIQRFGIEDNSSSIDRTINMNGHSLEIDSAAQFVVYPKATIPYPYIRGKLEVGDDFVNLSTVNGAGTLREYGFNAFQGLTQMFANGFLESSQGYVQVDTSQVILESDPNRLYVAHDSVSIVNFDSNPLDFRIWPLPSSSDTTNYKPLGITSTGQVKKFTSWPGSGNSGSPAGVDQDNQFNNSGSFGGSSGRWVWNNTAKRASIFGTSTADLTHDNDHSFKIIGNRFYLGDTTSNEPSIFEIGDPYGAANSTPMRMSFGWMGTEEWNIGVNFHYRGGVHQKYDNSKFAQWTAFNTHYYLMQAWGIGGDWNDNSVSKVPWRFDNIEVGNAIKGSILSTNGLNLVDYTTSSYQNNDGTMARLAVSSATMNFSGVTNYTLVDSGNLGISMAPDLGYRLSIKTTGSKAPTLFWNDDNNGNNMLNRFLRTKSGSYTLTAGTKVGYDINSVAGIYFKATSDAPGGFSSFDAVVQTQNSTGTTAERFFFGQNGDYRIGASAEDATALLNMSSTTRGVLFPRMNTTQQNAISSPTTGLMIVNTDSIGSSPLRIYNGSAWAPVAAGGGGGGSSYTFQNGVGASGSTVEWGGSVLSHDTKLDVNGNILRFVDGSATRFKLFSSGESVITNQLILGDSTQDDANNLFELEKVGGNTNWGMYNKDNNTNGNYFRFIKNRAGSYNLTDGDAVGYFDFNTLSYFKAIAGGTATGGFKPLHFTWGTTDNSGNTAERMRLMNNGNLLIGTTTDAGETLNVAGPVRLKASGLLKNTTALTDTANIRLTQNVRNVADNTDSVTNGMAIGNSFGSTLYHLRNTTVYSHLDLHESSNTARAELEITNNLSGSLLNDGAGIQMKQGNITLVAKDSLEIPATPASAADTVYAAGQYDPTSGTNIVLKIPTKSGTWTPTLSDITNSSGVSLDGARFTRVGNVVTFTIRFVTTTSAGASSTSISATLPVSSNFTNVNQAAGTNSGLRGYVEADASSDILIINWVSGTGGSETIVVSGQYTIF